MPRADALRQRPRGVRAINHVFTQQLRERLNRRASTPERGRNPFVYGSRHAAAPAAGATSRLKLAVAALPPPEPPAPQVKLSGIADAVSRTARRC